MMMITGRRRKIKFKGRERVQEREGQERRKRD
jgi:hypothetical protein